MAIDTKDVLHIATLARLALDETEIERFTEQLNSILEHVAQLGHAPERADTDREAAGSPLAERGLEPDPLALGISDFAPSERDGFFLVPRLASHDLAQQDDFGSAPDDPT